MRNARGISRVWLAIATTVLCSSLLGAQAAQADLPKCRTPVALAELVAVSDAIAVVDVRQFQVKGTLRSVLSGGDLAPSIEAMDVSINELLKKSYLPGAQVGASLRVHIPVFRMQNNTWSRAVLFMQYRKERHWVVPRCGLLPIDGSGAVREACDSIKDLFGNERFKRESRCLLSTPALVGLSELKEEIDRVTPHAHRFQGSADVVEVAPWNSTAAFQRVLLRFRGRALRDVLNAPFKGSELKVLAYYPTEQIDERRFTQQFRKGRRIQVDVTWFDGHLVFATSNP